MYRSHVLVCGGTGCTSSGSDRIVRALENNIIISLQKLIDLLLAQNFI